VPVRDSSCWCICGHCVMLRHLGGNMSIDLEAIKQQLEKFKLTEKERKEYDNFGYWAESGSQDYDNGIYAPPENEVDKTGYDFGFSSNKEFNEDKAT